MPGHYEPTAARVPHPFDDIPGLPCRTNPEAFFPTPGQDGGPGIVLCMTCPIERACLAFALQTRQIFGTWGGMNASSRSHLSATRRAELIETGRRQAQRLGINLEGARP